MPSIETNEVIILDMLNKDSVSVLTKVVATINDTEVQVGQNHRKAYVNSAEGRAELTNDLSEPYLSSVMAVWGDTPTVTEPAEEE